MYFFCEAGSSFRGGILPPNIFFGYLPFLLFLTPTAANILGAGFYEPEWDLQVRRLIVFLRESSKSFPSWRNENIEMPRVSEKGKYAGPNTIDSVISPMEAIYFPRASIQLEGAKYFMG